MIEYNRHFDQFEPLLLEEYNLPGVTILFDTFNGVVLIGSYSKNSQKLKETVMDYESIVRTIKSDVEQLELK